MESLICHAIPPAVWCGSTRALRVLPSALQPENIKVPLLAHVGSKDNFFPSKVGTLSSPPLH